MSGWKRFIVLGKRVNSYYHSLEEKFPVLDVKDFKVEKATVGALWSVRNLVFNDMFTAASGEVSIGSYSITPTHNQVSVHHPFGGLIGTVEFSGIEKNIYYGKELLGVSDAGEKTAYRWLGLKTEYSRGKLRVFDAYTGVMLLVVADVTSGTDHKVGQFDNQIQYAYKSERSFIVVSTITFSPYYLSGGNVLTVYSEYNLVKETRNHFFYTLDLYGEKKLEVQDLDRVDFEPKLAKGALLRGY